MKGRAPLLKTLSGSLAVAMCMGNVLAQESPEVDCTLGSSLTAGRVVHIDPYSGRPTSLPTPEQAKALEALQAAAANRSTRGLVQEPGPTGGVQVNMRNRFRSPLAAVTHEDGELQIDHLACKPAGDGA